jgi:hypothetical protein
MTTTSIVSVPGRGVRKKTDGPGATFAYDGWHWGQDIYAANLPGYCEDLGGWDKQPLQYPQDENTTRVRSGYWRWYWRNSH